MCSFVPLKTTSIDIMPPLYTIDCDVVHELFYDCRSTELILRDFSIVAIAWRTVDDFASLTNLPSSVNAKLLISMSEA